MIASNDSMNNESKRAWKEELVVYFKVPSQHLSGQPEENRRSLGQDSQSKDRVFNSVFHV